MIKKIIPIFLASALYFLPTKTCAWECKTAKQTAQVKQTSAGYKVYRSLLKCGSDREKDLDLEVRVSESETNKNVILSLKNHRTRMTIFDFGGNGFGPEDSILFYHAAPNGYSAFLSVKYFGSNIYKGDYRIESMSAFLPGEIDTTIISSIWKNFIGENVKQIAKYGSGIYTNVVGSAVNEREVPFPMRDFYALLSKMEKTFPEAIKNKHTAKATLLHLGHKCSKVSRERLKKPTK